MLVLLYKILMFARKFYQFVPRTRRLVDPVRECEKLYFFVARLCLSRRLLVFISNKK